MCKDTNRIDFRYELSVLINKHSKETGNDTPDFILADYLADCLDAFDKLHTRKKIYNNTLLKKRTI